MLKSKVKLTNLPKPNETCASEITSSSLSRTGSGAEDIKFSRGPEDAIQRRRPPARYIYNTLIASRARCFFMLIITITPLRNKRRRLAQLGVHRHMFTRSRRGPHMSYYLFWVSVLVARKRTCGRPVRPRIVGSLHPALSRLTRSAPRRKSKQRESHAKVRCELTKSRTE